MVVRLVLDFHSAASGSGAQHSPSLKVLADSEHALRVLERKQRAVHACLIHGGRAAGDALMRAGSLHMVHVPSHEGVLCNELADRIANVVREATVSAQSDRSGSPCPLR